MAAQAVVAATVLIPVCGVTAFVVLELLSTPRLPPFLWPIVIPALIPPLVMAFCLWALFPSLRAAIPARLADVVVWGATLLLCLSVFDFQHVRQRAIDQIEAAREKYEADLAKLPPDAPLWDSMPFLVTANYARQSDVIDRIRKLARRQSEAELMIERGDFPLQYLGSFDLTPTPALCDKTRALLRRQVAPLVLTSPNSKPYKDVALQVSGALSAMRWLGGYDCDIDAESQAWETMAKAYRDTNFDVYELAELRDPKNHGRILRMAPERFSMLTPKAHLAAWLSFADKKEFHDQALAGARQLDHRTADAVDMLKDKNSISAPWTVLKYMPVLDLEMTPPFCAAALAQVDGDLMKVYRPKADDPRPYSELLERLGAYEPLTALVWLAGRGCEAEPELSEAEELVRTYRDSPARVAMLATLERLHRKGSAR
ncbi:MAG TPA: hypothetical protein VFC45_02865 [Pseudolabrys sp.]|nr:hypothetical protein [Pseudolabrys sp.]